MKSNRNHIEYNHYKTAGKRCREGGKFTLIVIALLLMPALSVAQSSQDSIVTEELTWQDFESFGDYSAGKALWRVPGAQVNGLGALNLRGTGYNSYYITVNGMRMATTGAGSRAFHPQAISTDMISGIEYIKVLNPSMDADAISGIVNLKTYQPVGVETRVNVAAGGGALPTYYSETGGTGRAQVQYFRPLNDHSSMALNLSYQSEVLSHEYLENTYGTDDFGSGVVDVLEETGPGFNAARRDGIAGSLNLSLNPNAVSSFYVNGFINYDSRRASLHQNKWIANGGWIAQDSVGTQGSFNYSLSNTVSDITQYTFEAGGKNEAGKVIIDYSLGWANSQIKGVTHYFPFRETGVEYSVTTADRERPVASPEAMLPLPEDMNLGTMKYIVDQHIDNRYSARLNVEMPFEAGSIRAGASALWTTKDANTRGAYSEYDYDYRGTLNQEGFEKADPSDIFLFDDLYYINGLIDPDEAVSFFKTSIPNMRLDADEFNLNSGYRNYYVTENVYSGYGMANLEFGTISVTGGARLELTDAEYEGRKVLFNRFGSYERSSDTTRSANYMNIFPNAQITFGNAEGFSAHIAYSSAISRPDFNMLAPFLVSTPEDTSLFSGNPELDPVTSNNVDLFLHYKSEATGKLSAGLYYKKIDNYIVPKEETITIREGDYAFFDDYFDASTTEIEGARNSFSNLEESVTVYGFEISWKHRLIFLPGILRNLGTYAAYTWSKSEYTPPGREQITLPGQSPQVLNAAVDYASEKFQAQLSYHRSTRSLFRPEQNQRFAPSLNQTVYFDQYLDGAEELSLTTKYSISETVSIWANVYNLFGSETLEYGADSEAYPTRIYLREGVEFSAGIRLNF